jgi:hypothetical protein
MRLVPHNPDDETFASVDWRDGPADVLEKVSELLAPHGLCIVLADTQDDSYRFKVVKEAGGEGEWQPIAALAPKTRALVGRWMSSGESSWWTQTTGYFVEHADGEGPSKEWILEKAQRMCPFYGEEPTHFLAIAEPPAIDTTPAPVGDAP